MGYYQPISGACTRGILFFSRLYLLSTISIIPIFKLSVNILFGNILLFSPHYLSYNIPSTHILLISVPLRYLRPRWLCNQFILLYSNLILISREISRGIFFGEIVNDLYPTSQHHALRRDIHPGVGGRGVPPPHLTVL